MNKYLQIIDTIRKPGSLSDYRHRQIALATVSSLLSRISALILTYFSVALAVGKLGPLNFGLWMTVNSMSVLLPFADFGLGNGLVSYVARRVGESRQQLIPPAVAACLYMTSLAGLILAAVGTVAVHSPLLLLIFRQQAPNSLSQVIPASQIFFILLGITLPLSIVEKVQMGCQDAYLTNLWQIGSNLCTCLGIYITSQGRCTLYDLVLIYSGVPVVFKVFNFVSYFVSRTSLAPSFKAVDWKTGRYLFKCGLSFVLLQSSVALGYACDNIILAAQSGAVAVGTYDVAQRLFSLTVIAELSITPLWGAFGEALSRGDVKWVKATFYRSLKGNGLLALSLSIILLAAGPTLIHIWTHGKIQAPISLLAAFAFWRVFNILQGNLSVLLNHESTLRRQTYYFLSAAIASFVLKFALLDLFGISGVVFATVISFSVLYAVPCLKMAHRIFQRPQTEDKVGELAPA